MILTRERLLVDIFLTRRLSKSLAFCEFASFDFEPWQRLNRPAVNAAQWRHHYPKTRQWFLLADCLNIRKIMRNFSGNVAWYSEDQIPGMLAWSSNISIIFIVNSKIARLRNWNARLNCEWKKSLRRVGRFFIKSRFVVSAEILFMRSFWDQCWYFEPLAIFAVKYNDSVSFLSCFFVFFFLL